MPISSGNEIDVSLINVTEDENYANASLHNEADFMTGKQYNLRKSDKGDCNRPPFLRL